jgi:hypothetical protein
VACALERVRSGADLGAVGEPVAVGVPLAWARVVATDFGAIMKPIAVGVLAARVGVVATNFSAIMKPMGVGVVGARVGATPVFGRLLRPSRSASPRADFQAVDR